MIFELLLEGDNGWLLCCFTVEFLNDSRDLYELECSAIGVDRECVDVFLFDKSWESTTTKA